MEAKQVPDALTEILRWRDSLSEMPPAATEEEAIDRITALEELTSACAAAQARETLTFDMHRKNREAEDGVPSKKQGLGVGAEIGLARKVSRHRGNALLKFSRTLLLDLPNVYSAMKGGDISEEKARTVAKESDWLPREKKHELDERMAERLAEVGVRRLGNEVRALAQKLDQQAAVDHLERCVEERSVSVRPAPGNMAYLTALLPMSQAVAAFANLKKSAQTVTATGKADGRGQNQIAADLLVERLTGQAAAAAVPTEVHLIMQDSSLFGSGEESAWFPGVGPIPAQAARNVVAENEAATFIRRLYTRPEDGQLVRMDSRRREFSGLLRRMVVFRDDVCRSPWCEAPIQHADHVDAAAAGGETDWDNSSGLCAACNYLKELSGWRHQATAEALEVITPTGHHYRTRTKPLSGPDPGCASGQDDSRGARHGPGEQDPPDQQHDRQRQQLPGRQHGPEPGRDTGEAAAERTATPVDGARAATPVDGARAAPPSDSDCAGALGGSDRAEKLDDEARVVPPRADPEFSVMIPWRYVRRTSQPATIDIGGSSVGIDIVDADERPMSPTEELLRAAILEHRRRL
ncbi:MAG: DUF222 domain-containing protein [Brevibacterium linens]|uniref:DUF222 domain-containing protein n=1 Tax=Brevibacterium linens TaxID=1703 RepID=UPI003F964EEC